MRTLSIAATGMNAQQTNVDVIANNIANANTTGYKTQRAAFQDLMYDHRRKSGAQEQGAIRPVGVDIGMGVQTAGTIRLNTEGSLTETKNPLDLAIQGQGYFVVTRPDGTDAYTRDGGFSLNADGQIVTVDGYPLQPGITVPANSTLSISADGTVEAYVNGATTATQLGQITLATFVNPEGLEPQGNNLFLRTDASGDADVVDPGLDGVGTIKEGYLESSNVDIVKQVTELITAQRAYEMNSKAMNAADEMMQNLTQIR